MEIRGRPCLQVLVVISKYHEPARLLNDMTTGHWRYFLDETQKELFVSVDVAWDKAAIVQKGVAYLMQTDTAVGLPLCTVDDIQSITTKRAYANEPRPCLTNTFVCGCNPAARSGLWRLGASPRTPRRRTHSRQSRSSNANPEPR